MDIDHAVLKAVAKLEPEAYAFAVYLTLVPSLNLHPSRAAFNLSIRFLKARGLMITLGSGNLMRLTGEGRKLTI